MTGGLSLGLGLGLSRQGGGGAPAWVPSGAVAAVDYTTGRLYKATRSFSRDSEGWMLDGDGILQHFAAGAIRRLDGIGALFEPEATNIVPYAYDLSSWPNNSGSPTAIDGEIRTSTGLRDQIATYDTSNVFSDATSAAPAASTQYTWSFFFRQGTKPDVSAELDDRNFSGNRFRFQYVFVGESLNCRLTTDKGDGASVDSSDVIDLGNGLLLGIMTFTTGSLAATAWGLTYRYSDEGTGNVALFGTQLETGNKATSRILTNGDAATRSADVETISPTEQDSVLDWHARYDDDSEEEIATGVTGDFAVDPVDLTRPVVKAIWATDAGVGLLDGDGSSLLDSDKKSLEDI